MATAGNPVASSSLVQNGHFLFRSRQQLLLGLIYLSATFFPAWFWLGQVTKNVPEPYLVRAIPMPVPNFVTYVRSGRSFSYPPSTGLLQRRLSYLGSENNHSAGPVSVLLQSKGVLLIPDSYVFSTAFVKLARGGVCDVYSLRLFNMFVLSLTMLCSSACRDLITGLFMVTDPSVTKASLKFHRFISPDTVHTAINVIFFPPLFFFSGLFYTDVASTCLVLVVYTTFLYSDSMAGGFGLFASGILALTMRQTNIFWVAVFMGGLEVVRTIKSIKPVRLEKPKDMKPGLKEILFIFERYKQGNIHDVPLITAETHGMLPSYDQTTLTDSMEDFFLCAISIAVATIYRPILIATRLWPYMALLVSFAGFVAWNGGVVLGTSPLVSSSTYLQLRFYRGQV